MTINVQNLKAVLREIAAVIGVVVGLTNDLHLPASIRATVLAVSGSLLTIDHAVSKILDPGTSINVTSNPTKVG